MPYNTGNAMPSKDPRDLHDNASNFDNFSNGSNRSYPDRFGVSRLSLAGYGMVFDEEQLLRDAQFQAFLVAAGYVWIGDYAAGLIFTARNQYMARSGSTYRVAPTTAIPYTLTGDWATDQPNLVLLETTGTILSQLAATTGAGLVGAADGTTVQASLDARLRRGIPIGSANLNSYTSSSHVALYYQATDSNATLALNYPVAAIGGTLSVLLGAGTTVLQEFTTKTLRKFVRWCSDAAAPTFTPWREVTLPPAGSAGQVLLNTGPGIGEWGDAPSSPGIRDNLTIVWQGSPTARVRANRLSVTNAAEQSVTLVGFDQSATDGGTSGVPNSLDTGTWAAGGQEYFLFAIYNPVSNTRALLWSLSATAPLLPAGYTHFCRVGSNIRVSGSFYQANQYGTNLYLQTPFTRNLIAGAVGTISNVAVTWAGSSVSGLVPTTAQEVLLQLSAAGANGSTTTRSLVAAAPTSAFGAPDSLAPPYASTSVSGGSVLAVSMVWMPLFTRTVYCASNGSGGSVRIMGWRDNL